MNAIVKPIHTSAVEADSVIATMTRASQALAEAKTIQQTKKIIDAAAAAEIYAKRQKLGDEASELALSIKIEALRKLGEMLAETPKAKGVRTVGGDHRSGGSISAPPENEAQTLADLGLTKKESAVAQKLAALPESEFQQVRDGHVTVAKAIAAVSATKPKAAPIAPAASQADPLDKAREHAREQNATIKLLRASIAERDATIEALRSELKEARDVARDLAESLESLQKSGEGDEAVAKEIKRLTGQMHVVETQRDSCMVKCNEMAKSIRGLKHKLGERA